MSSMTEELKEEAPQRKVTKEDFDAIADYIFNEFARRKRARKDSEKVWAEIDRQLAMKPSVAYKRNADGTVIKGNAWMPEIELPNQSQTLEILCSDANRMEFPENGPFFKAKAYADEQFLENFAQNSAFIVGSQIDPPSQITYDNVNDFVSGFVTGKLKQFDHEKVWDLINGEAFKYGVGVGRGRLVSKSVFIHDASVTYNKSVKIPILAPISIKNVYLDDMVSDYMASGAYIGPSIIFQQVRRLADIRMAAKRGGDDYIGEGWIESSFKDLEPDKNGNVTLLEYEGDLVLPKNGSNESLFFPNVILTILNGKCENKTANRLVRIQYNKTPFSSYIIVPYHQEHINNPYGGSPLIKGMPIQKSASEALNRLMQVAMLDAQPIIKYDCDDQYFTNKGGPMIHPGAQWPTIGDVEVIKIGNPASILAAYQALLSQYSDVTGINAPRLGAQTVSHTTAYAKDQEIERGQVRTVDYVRSVLKSPMERWLGMCYYLARDEMDDNVEQIYMETYNSYVNVKSDLLPETVCFEVFGSGGPAESMARKQQKQSALMSAIQLNQVAVQSGLAAPLNFDAITKQLLKEAGITDVDAFTTVPQGAQAGPAVQGIDKGNPGFNPGALTIGLQGLQKAIG